MVTTLFTETQNFMMFWVSLFFLGHPPRGDPTQRSYGKVKNEYFRTSKNSLPLVVISSDANSFKFVIYARNWLRIHVSRSWWLLYAFLLYRPKRSWQKVPLLHGDVLQKASAPPTLSAKIKKITSAVQKFGRRPVLCA